MAMAPTSAHLYDDQSYADASAGHTGQGYSQSYPDPSAQGYNQESYSDPPAGYDQSDSYTGAYVQENTTWDTQQQQGYYPAQEQYTYNGHAYVDEYGNEWTA